MVEAIQATRGKYSIYWSPILNRLPLKHCIKHKADTATPIVHCAINCIGAAFYSLFYYHILKDKLTVNIYFH